MIRPLVSDYNSALEFLLGRVNFERTTTVPYQSATFKFDRMRRLLALVGDPHLGLKAVHLAGTKGKGSTAAMVAAILRASSRSTGLYTSPHLSRIEERIVIDGVPCSEAEFTGLAAELAEAVGRLVRQPGEVEHDPTFFEVTTAMAFLHFARRKVDAAVLEVGLGGRLDSTNVCQPSVTIITSISFDHTKQLGNTLAEIAGEKAGIIKPGVPCISGELKDEPRQVIERIAAERRAPLWQLGREFDYLPANSLAADSLDAASPGERLDYFEPVGSESPQAANAALAVAGIHRLNDAGWNISPPAIREGLASARVAARIEVVVQRPTVIVDVAHNVASIEALVAVLAARFTARRRWLVFASSRDKDSAGMLARLLPQFDEVILTQYIENPRAVEPEQLLALAQQALPLGAAAVRPVLHVAPTPGAAWTQVSTHAGREDLVCITGSFFLAAELRPLVLASRLDSRSPVVHP
ncbi:MAG: bifunctional folylpolyglutamate synthase/dihydrofolate synthase [Pirellulaceae bacterium]|nr:bifunctional folylpolyglutamate synthase/dihydrofolate synthase [Pirellulaceae bacterium]